MAKRFFTVICSVLLVLSIAFSLSSTCNAATGYEGAYRTIKPIVLYIPYGINGYSGEAITIGNQQFASFYGYVTVPVDVTFVADAAGYSKVYGSDGSTYLIYIPSYVAGGKMIKIY